MKRVLAVARRELAVYFDSPIAYIFLALFLVAMGWLFFDRQSFFDAGQATMRGFFGYVPIVFVLFVPAITMRLWAEERRAGTEELLLTLPMKPIEVVLGKFLAAWALLGTALLCSFPLALTVAALGPLDWGPVWGGYFGAMLLGAAGLALGLFLSSMTRNQIVAFILTLAALFFLVTVGAPEVLVRLPASLVPWAEFLSLSSHYESAARGVLDLRDLVYYAGFVGLFLYFNCASLAWRRWS